PAGESIKCTSIVYISYPGGKEKEIGFPPFSPFPPGMHAFKILISKAGDLIIVRINNKPIQPINQDWIYIFDQK
ncbi:hypothetical protein OnM2_004033, partial [Erysiphe neolycopersici]